MPAINCSMGGYLNVVTPYLQTDLVSPEVLSQIQTIAQLLPPFPIGCLECRLGAEQLRVDFAVCVPCGILSIPKKFQNYPIWQAHEGFYQEWSKSTSILHQKVRNLYFEFDLDGQSSEVLLPCVFLAFNQNAINEASSLNELSTYWPLRLLFNQFTSSRFEFNLQRCIYHLPEGAWIAHIGIMLSRQTQMVRFVIKGIPLQQLPYYLTQIGWIAPIDKLTCLVKTLADFVDYLTLDLDVGEQIGSQIGIECYIEKQPPNESRWHSFLKYLVTRGLCTSAKQDTLLDWPGITQKADCPERWPSNLALGDQFLASLAHSIFYRKISHIKIVYHPDLPLSAKVYLEFGHQWIKHNSTKKT